MLQTTLPKNFVDSILPYMSGYTVGEINLIFRLIQDNSFEEYAKYMNNAKSARYMVFNDITKDIVREYKETA